MGDSSTGQRALRGGDGTLDGYRRPYDAAYPVVCNVFMATEPLAGKRLTKVTERKIKIDWQFTTDDARVKLKRLYSIFDV